MKSINEKIENLPKDVLDVLDSAWAASINLDILNINGLSVDKSDILLDLISAIFVKEISLDELPKKLSNSLDISLDEANKIACDIAGMRLYNIEKWLGVKIDNYVLSWGGDLNSYKNYPEEEKKNLILEEKYFLEQTEADPEFIFVPKKDNNRDSDPEIDIEKEKKDAPDVFRKHVLDIIFNYELRDIIEEYNDILILALEDENFKMELVSALQNNQEIVSDKRLITNEKEQQSTIGNWLIDFIKTEGSDIFDDLKIIEYLNLSKNSKNLQEKDKIVLRKVFKLYKNIAFFPESLSGVPRGDWQIIPIDNLQDEIVPKQEKKIVIERLMQQNELEPARHLIEAKTIDNENKENQRLKELKNALANYPVSSLEYKALVQEINRLEKLEKNR